MQNQLIELHEGTEPVIAGTAITVASVLEELTIGDSIADICSEHHLTREQVRAAWLYGEMHLPRAKYGEVCYPIPGEVAAPDEGLDYGQLASNAGYFSPDACPLYLPK